MAEWGVWVSGLNIEKKWQVGHQIDFIVLIVQYNVTKKTNDHYSVDPNKHMGILWRIRYRLFK